MVQVTCRATGHLHEQPAVTRPAPDGAFQEVRMLTGSLALAMALHYLLHFLPRSFIRQFRVAAIIVGVIVFH